MAQTAVEAWIEEGMAKGQVLNARILLPALLEDPSVRCRKRYTSGSPGRATWSDCKQHFAKRFS